MWQDYKKRLSKQRRVLEPYASINARGEIFINRSALALMDGAINIVLFYDPELNHLGIRGARQGDLPRKVFSAKRCGRGKRSRIIRARRLFRHFGVSIDRTLVFTTFQTEPGPMLILDLSTAEPLTVGSSNK